LYLSPDIIIIIKEKGRKTWSCRMNMTRDMCTGLSEILYNNEQSFPFLGSYMYTKLQTQ